MRNDQWGNPGAKRLNGCLRSLLPAGGAKLLEEETAPCKGCCVSGWKRLRILLVSWQFLFQSSFYSLVLASFKFQK